MASITKKVSSKTGSNNNMESNKICASSFLFFCQTFLLSSKFFYCVAVTNMPFLTVKQ